MRTSAHALHNAIHVQKKFPGPEIAHSVKNMLWCESQHHMGGTVALGKAPVLWYLFLCFSLSLYLDVKAAWEQCHHSCVSPWVYKIKINYYTPDMYVLAVKVLTEIPKCYRALHIGIAIIDCCRYMFCIILSIICISFSGRFPGHIFFLFS